MRKANGHLTLLLNNTAYLERAHIAFVIPATPGPAPVHQPGATAAQIAENIRLYKKNSKAYKLYHQVATTLKSQILTAVEATYLNALEHVDYGYANVTPLMMLTHLKTTCAKLTPKDLETNRALLSLPWNPDEPIEHLWKRIDKCHCIATSGDALITNAAGMSLTLSMFEQSRLLAVTTNLWRFKGTAFWTREAFKSDFTLANQERHRKLTAATAGYHSANFVSNAVPPINANNMNIPAAYAVAATNQGANEATCVLVNSVELYYCWSHELGSNRDHTSATCLPKKHGHKDNATIFKRQGGNDRINLSRPRRNER